MNQLADVYRLARFPRQKNYVQVLVGCAGCLRSTYTTNVRIRASQDQLSSAI